MTENTVELYIYDLSKGVAAMVSPALIGKRIDGIWHTSVVVYGREYFFGSRGIESCNPGGTALGEPNKKLKLGETQVPYSVFIDYLGGLSHSSFTNTSYDLLRHNCNNFTEEIAQFLCGTSIPKYILDLPNEVLQTSLGPAIHALALQLEKSARPVEDEQAQDHIRRSREGSPGLDQLNSEIEEARYNSFISKERHKRISEKLARRERRKEKKRKKLLQQEHSQSPDCNEVQMAEAETINGAGAESQLPTEQAMALEEEERREDEERKKAREPPIVYKDTIDVKTEFDALVGLLDGKLSPEEQKCVEELQQYMIGDEGSWVLSDNFLDFIGRLLRDTSFSADARVKIVNILAAAALKDDIILLLHQDRKDHVLMNYAYDIDRHGLEEQQALALFIVNMFENLSSSEWLMYISEWTYSNQQTSNIRVTTKVAVHSLLADAAILQEYGAAIIYNLACKEKMFKNFRIRKLLPKGSLSKVFDDVAVELTMAILQFFNSKPAEELLFRCMKALSKFTLISGQEVPQLIQMIGPDPKTFKGTSERIDDLIAQIAVKVH